MGKTDINSSKTGLFKLGYVTNLKTCKAELNAMLANEKQVSTTETILPLDAVYQNARLIAKPDETWLNPDTIL